MTHNLVVSFEIRDWVRQGPLIVGAIEELGAAVRIFGTTWYVHSDLGAEEAAQRVSDIMNAADGLAILDVSENAIATFNVDDRSVRFMCQHWRDSAPQTPWHVSPTAGRLTLETQMSGDLLIETIEASCTSHSELLKRGVACTAERASLSDNLRASQA
jgi:hypothetical protein